MTKDEIIKLIRTTTQGSQSIEKIEAFASACYEAGRTAEREDCAKVCEAIEEAAWLRWKESADNEDQAPIKGAFDCAEAIRARGKP